MGIILFGCFFTLIVVRKEAVVLWILLAFGEVEGEGKMVEDLLGVMLVVLSHCVEEGFLVTNDKILAHVILNTQYFRIH